MELHIDSVEHHKGRDPRGPALDWRHLHFGRRGLERYANFDVCFLASASPGLSGYVRQALIVFLQGFLPMYVNLGPRFRTVGAEVASVVK